MRQLIELPIASGDEINIIDNEGNFISKGVVTSISLDQNKKGEWKKRFTVYKTVDGKIIDYGIWCLLSQLEQRNGEFFIKYEI